MMPKYYAEDYPDPQTIDNPCTECGGDGYVEEANCFEQGRTDGRIVYQRFECEHCGGTGEEPEPKDEEEEEP